MRSHRAAGVLLPVRHRLVAGSFFSAAAEIARCNSVRSQLEAADHHESKGLGKALATKASPEDDEFARR